MMAKVRLAPVPPKIKLAPETKVGSEQVTVTTRLLPDVSASETWNVIGRIDVFKGAYTFAMLLITGGVFEAVVKI